MLLHWPLVLLLLGAFKLGSFPPLALRAVLFTAYVAFFLGAATYYFVVRRYFRKFSRSRLELLGKTWRFVFDEAGVRYRPKTADVRLTWRGIDSVEEGGRAVFSCLGWQAIFIPSRVFPNSAARIGFLAATAAWIKAAAESTAPRALRGRFARHDLLSPGDG